LLGLVRRQEALDETDGEGDSMTQNLKIAEQMVKRLIAETHRAQFQITWNYELTNEVDNIDVLVDHSTHTLRIHPCWLRYVVSQGDFKSCVSDEITAWYLLDELTHSVKSAA
jgi:hypothetical protein